MANKEVNKTKNNFIKGVRSELKKVTWPAPKQLLNNTVAVIIIVLIASAIVCVADLVFKSINESVVSQVEKMVDNTVEEDLENTIKIETDSEDTTIEVETTVEDDAADENTSDLETSVE